MARTVNNKTRNEKITGMLDERYVESDPFSQFAIWFEDVKRAGVPEPEAMFLATVGKDGHPSGRIVLLKGFDEKGFVFYTNYDSQKGREIKNNPFVAITFHWKELERQVRILGIAKKVSRKMADDYFDTRPPGSRLSAVISPQSDVVPSRKFLDDLKREYLKVKGDRKIVRPENWGGFLVKPHMFEFWQGRDSRLHDRIRYRSGKREWIIERLAP